MANENLKTVKSIIDRDTLPGSFAADLADYRAHDIRLADIASVADKTATGSAITPEPTVTLAGKTLTKNTDFTYAYADNTAVGTAKITVTGTGSYFFSKQITFAIVAADADDAG